MMNTMRTCAMAIALALPGAAFGATIELDFGDGDRFPDFNVQGAQADLTNVAPGSGEQINARFTALNDWAFTDAAPRVPGGTDNADFRVRADEGETAKLRLEIFDATVGGGFDALYDPGRPFDWSLVLYDIDNDPVNEPVGRSFDSFLLRTPGTLSLAKDTALTVTTMGAGTLVAADETTVNTDTNSGTTTLSAEQQRYAAVYDVANTSVIELDYIIGAVGDPNDRPRLAFIDGGNLVIDDPDTLVVDGTVPLPAGFALMLTAVGGLGVAARRRA